jgi:hypothetical protein
MLEGIATRLRVENAATTNRVGSPKGNMKEHESVEITSRD